AGWRCAGWSRCRGRRSRPELRKSARPLVAVFGLCTTAAFLQLKKPKIPMTIATRSGTHLTVLVVLGMTHLLNDLMQSLIPAAYPILKESYALDFVQIGLITMTFQI